MIMKRFYGLMMTIFCLCGWQSLIAQSDCITTATDLTPQINAAQATAFGWDCTPAAGQSYTGATGDATLTALIGGANTDDCDLMNEEDKGDVWYTFTSSGTSDNPVWVSIDETSLSFVLGLYRLDAPLVGSCGSFTGGTLTYIDCSRGTGVGMARDVSQNTTANERIDISSLPAGTYYIRLWEFGDATPEDGDYALCVQNNTPILGGVDDCSGLTSPTVGCGDGTVRGDVVSIFLNQSNVGTFGNTGLGPANPNGLLAAGGAGLNDPDCSSGFTTTSLYTNNVVNNNVMYRFDINNGGCPDEPALVSILFDNVVTCCGNPIQVQVVGPDVCISAGAVMSLSREPVAGGNCFILTSGTQALGQVGLADGAYYIQVDGSDGALVKYDLTVAIDYPDVSCADADCAGAAQPLPVELLSFEGAAMSNYNMLKWVTGSEVNTSHFELERSENGQDFETAGSIKSAGFSTDAIQYDFEDRRYFGKTYYRLKSIDLDGTFDYSNVIVLAREQNTGISVFPNPSKGIFNIQFEEVEKEEETTIEVRDLIGRLVQSQTILIGNGQVDLSDEPTGIYFISFEKNGIIHSQRIVKQ